MVAKLLIAWSLMALCVVAHAAGTTALLRWVGRRAGSLHARFWPSTRMLVRIAGWIVGLHLIEIAIWAAFYAWDDALPDLPTALYFSAVTYTTTGYGDVVLEEAWRLVGAIEALTGILLCGWSAAFFFAVANRMQPPPSPPEPT
jgi:voltage-gated potassium channel Kch